MPAPYQIPSSTDTSSIYNVFLFLNQFSFMAIMTFVVWIVALIGAFAEGRQASRAFIFASFGVSILAVILSLISLLNSQYMYFTFLMVGAGLIWYKLDTAIGI